MVNAPNYISISTIGECLSPYEGILGNYIVENYFDLQDVAIEDTFDRERVVNLLKEISESPEFNIRSRISTISGTTMVKKLFYV